MLQPAHRVAANDLPLPSPEIEFFCTCMHITYNPGNTELKFFGRHNRKQPDSSAVMYAAPLLSLPRAPPPLPPCPTPPLSVSLLIVREVVIGVETPSPWGNSDSTHTFSLGLTRLHRPRTLSLLSRTLGLTVPPSLPLPLPLPFPLPLLFFPCV